MLKWSVQIMDVSWMDCGDLIKIKTSDSTIYGQVIKITTDNLLLRDTKGLKAMINLEKIEYIQQMHIHQYHQQQ